MTPIDQRAREAATYITSLLGQNKAAQDILILPYLIGMLTAQHAEDVAAGEKVRQSASTLAHMVIASRQNVGKAMIDVADALASATQPTQP